MESNADDSFSQQEEIVFTEEITMRDLMNAITNIKTDIDDVKTEMKTKFLASTKQVAMLDMAVKTIKRDVNDLIVKTGEFDFEFRKLKSRVDIVEKSSRASSVNSKNSDIDVNDDNVISNEANDNLDTELNNNFYVGRMPQGNPSQKFSGEPISKSWGKFNDTKQKEFELKRRIETAKIIARNQTNNTNNHPFTLPTEISTIRKNVRDVKVDFKANSANYDNPEEYDDSSDYDVPEYTVRGIQSDSKIKNQNLRNQLGANFGANRQNESRASNMDINELTLDTVLGSLNYSESTKNSKPTNLVYIQETVQYSWQMKQNSIAQLMELNDQFLEMKGKYKGVEIYVAKLVHNTCIKSIVDNYNNYLRVNHHELMKYADVQHINKFDWHNLPNKKCMEMIIEWVRPFTLNAYAGALVNYVKDIVPQTYDITQSYFPGYFHDKINTLMDNIEKMYLTFTEGNVVSRNLANIPYEVWEEYNRPGIVKIFFVVLGKHRKKIYNFCQGKSKIKEHKTLKSAFDYIRDKLQDYRELCIKMNRAHSDMTDSDFISPYDNDKSSNNMDNAIVKFKTPYIKNNEKYQNNKTKYNEMSSYLQSSDTLFLNDDNVENSDDDSIFQQFHTPNLSIEDDENLTEKSNKNDYENDDIDLDMTKVYPDKSDDDINAMSNEFSKERSSRTAIRDYFRGYCVEKLVYGSCTSGPKCS